MAEVDMMDAEIPDEVPPAPPCENLAFIHSMLPPGAVPRATSGRDSSHCQVSPNGGFWEDYGGHSTEARLLAGMEASRRTWSIV